MPLTRRSAALLLEAQAGEATKEPPPQSLGAPPLALSDLGDDLLSSILSHLPPEDLLAAALVSREWRKLTSADSIWRPHCEVSGASAGARPPVPSLLVCEVYAAA
jgi:hypothetical protein